MQSSYFPLQLYSQFPKPDLYSWAIIPTIMDKNVDTFEENALYQRPSVTDKHISFVDSQTPSPPFQC